MSTGGVHKTFPQNWQMRTTLDSGLQCSYEHETDIYSNLEVLDNLNYVMALEGELQYWKSWCMLPSSNNRLDFVRFKNK